MNNELLKKLGLLTKVLELAPTEGNYIKLIECQLEILELKK